MLEIVGLSPAQQSLYELLLVQAPSPLTQLRQAVADREWADQLENMLADLEELGLVARQPSSPPRYVVVPPDTAFDPLIAARTRALAEAHQRVFQLSSRFDPVAARRDPLDLVEVVYGREEMRRRWEEVQRSAHDEICGFDAPPYVGDPASSNSTEFDLLRKGVSYRTLYDRRAVDLPGRLRDLEQGVSAGEVARVGDVPMKLVLSDAPLALVPLRRDPDDIEAMFVVHDTVLLEALRALFEMYWEQAIPLGVQRDTPQTHGGEPSGFERKLLPLLVAGLSDRAIAAHLGRHERTVRNHVQRMMTKLDSATRFQAGYQAVLRGWLTDEEKGAHGEQ